MPSHNCGMRLRSHSHSHSLRQQTRQKRTDSERVYEIKNKTKKCTASSVASHLNEAANSCLWMTDTDTRTYMVMRLMVNGQWLYNG